MATISKALLDALEVDESCDLDEIIQQRQQADFEALLSLLALEASVKPAHRERALYALGRWGNRAAVAPILGLLPHLEPTERIRTIDALGRLNAQEALAGILDYANDQSPHVRKFVTRALGRINSPEAQTKLREIERHDAVDFIRSLASKCLRRQ